MCCASFARLTSRRTLYMICTTKVVRIVWFMTSLYLHVCFVVCISYLNIVRIIYATLRGPVMKRRTKAPSDVFMRQFVNWSALLIKSINCQSIARISVNLYIAVLINELLFGDFKTHTKFNQRFLIKKLMQNVINFINWLIKAGTFPVCRTRLGHHTGGLRLQSINIQKINSSKDRTGEDPFPSTADFAESAHYSST